MKDKKKLLATFFVLMLLLLTTTVKTNAQITIGDDITPQKFSVLELISQNEKKGGLRMAQLTTAERDSITLTSTFQSEKEKKAIGLTIMNITTGCMEYWNGKKWVGLCESTEKAVSELECSGNYAVTLAVGVDANADAKQFQVQYKNGNGGSYPAEVVKSNGDMTNLIAIRQEGTLNNGDGSVTYHIYGVPEKTSINTQFNISLGGRICIVAIKTEVDPCRVPKLSVWGDQAVTAGSAATIIVESDLGDEHIKSLTVNGVFVLGNKIEITENRIGTYYYDIIVNECAEQVVRARLKVEGKQQ